MTTPNYPYQPLFDDLLADSTPPVVTVITPASYRLAAIPPPSHAVSAVASSPLPSPNTVPPLNFPLPVLPVPPPFVPPTSTDEKQPTPNDRGDERTNLEQQIERLEHALYEGEPASRQTLDIQRRIAALENQLAVLNDDESRPTHRTRESVRRRGSHQEVASAVTRQNLGQGDHRTTTTTRTTTTVRKDRRTVVQLTSNSVSAPLGGDDNNNNNNTSSRNNSRGGPRTRSRSQRGRGTKRPIDRPRI